MEKTSRRQALLTFGAGSLAALTGCNWDGHFSLLGYSTRPNYAPELKTIYVPIFNNKAFQWTPHRGAEMELTRAVIREIEATTPLKVISDCNRADTELLGTLVTLNKNLLNRNQQNEVREGEVALGVELVWRNLRTQQVLSNPRRPIGILQPGELPAFDQENQPRPEGPEIPIPALIVLSGRYLPEVGESNASAQQRVCNRLAKQIVQMMESDWCLPPNGMPMPLPTAP